MIQAIDDDLLDAIAIAGRLDVARDRLAGWQSIADTAVLMVPFYGVAQDLAREMFLAILDVFGAARTGAEPGGPEAQPAA
jgi:hypothetical protein